jgi:hypothetical protein
MNSSEIFCQSRVKNIKMQSFAQLLARRAVRPPSRATLNAAGRRMLTAAAQQSRKAVGWRYQRTARQRRAPRGD